MSVHSQRKCQVARYVRKCVEESVPTARNRESSFVCWLDGLLEIAYVLVAGLRAWYVLGGLRRRGGVRA